MYDVILLHTSALIWLEHSLASLATLIADARWAV
jgi:hypothetical protein